MAGIITIMLAAGCSSLNLCFLVEPMEVLTCAVMMLCPEQLGISLLQSCAHVTYAVH
jgi:hypothetical protein